ncbi:hypothetical protein V8C40DRAFT_253798, partial [Trichoderma camerunense]
MTKPPDKAGQGTDLLRQIDSVGKEATPRPCLLSASSHVRSLRFSALPCPRQTTMSSESLVVMPDDQDLAPIYLCVCTLTSRL